MPPSSPSSRSYRAYDLTINSQLEVIGALPTEEEGNPPTADIDIVMGAVKPLQDPISLAQDGTAFLHFPEIARFACNADRIVVDCDAAADPHQVRATLIANALPCALWQRGDIVLHATAFIPAGAATAIGVCASSGGGKSSILRSALGHGAKSVADDTVRIASTDQRLRASGLPAATWSKREGDERELLNIATGQCASSAGLAAIFLVENDLSQRDVPSFERLSGASPFTSLMANRHRPVLPQMLGTQAANLAIFARLAQLPVYCWHRLMGAPDLAKNEVSFLSQIAKDGP